MIPITKFQLKTDYIGSIASTMCLAHCLITPFIFVAHAGHIHGHHSHPFWWGLIDLLFMVISLFAVFWSAKNTSKYWIKFSLWISWILLAAVILNEKLAIVQLSEALIYVPSIALAILHLYNRRYCTCDEKNCCVAAHSHFKNDE